MSSIRRLPIGRYFNIFRYWLSDAVRRRAVSPYYASFKVTSRCHFRCHFCDIWKYPHSDLGTGEVKRVLDNLARSSLLLVSFEGGEPLMRDDIGELLHYAGTLPFYILFTTSELNLADYPMADYSRYIDFLHISIDEGHRNLTMFDQLEKYGEWGAEVSVQTVVTNRTLSELEWKVARCRDAGATIVVMPAVNLNGRGDHYPDPTEFGLLLSRLKRKYPGTVLTTDGFLRAIKREHGCSAASIIIRSDGELYYPCRVLERTIGNLVERDLTELLRGKEAESARREMAGCTLRCGWYQYFAIGSYTDPREAVSLLRRHV